MATDKDNRATDNNVNKEPDIQVVRIVPVGSEDPSEVSRRDRVLIFTIVAILLVISVVAVIGFLLLKPGPDTVQGQGEATEVRISGKLPGRVEDIYVEEGQKVKKGDTLVHITSTLADAQLAQAEAMEEVAKAGEAKIDAGTRIQLIKAAEDVWKQAQASSSITETTFKRMDALYKKGVVSAQRRDEAKAAYDVAKAGESAARNSYELAKSGAQREDKMASSAMVRAARESVKKVDAVLEDQYLLAPFDGEVVSIYPNVSELIATGAPVMTLQLNDHWTVFNVRETLLKDIKLGTKIKVYIPALDKEENMKVFYIKDMGTYANWQATKATGDYDARTFQIKARPEKPIENFRPGMSAVYLGVAE